MLQSQVEIKPFHQWKSEQVKADSEKNGVFRFYRLRDWYFTAYGAYCQKVRNERIVQDKK